MEWELQYILEDLEGKIYIERVYKTTCGSKFATNLSVIRLFRISEANKNEEKWK